ncbi:conserved hypothetical protein [Gammaproteobacteria bacterium]
MKTVRYQSAKETAKKLAPLVVVASLALVPEIASADAASAIDAAIAQGQVLLGKVGPGIIAIAALMTGVGLVISWIKK